MEFRIVIIKKSRVVECLPQIWLTPKVVDALGSFSLVGIGEFLHPPMQGPINEIINFL